MDLLETERVFFLCTGLKCIRLELKLKLKFLNFFEKLTRFLIYFKPTQQHILRNNVFSQFNYYSTYKKLVFSLFLTSGGGLLRHVSYMYFFYILGSSSFRLLQFGQVLSNRELSNHFHTNYYRMKFDNLFYCLLKFKMNKEINKTIEIYLIYLIYSHLKIT